jgi:2-oxoglutarate/2-oxoacid ferredoxin oxidoreductase subunit alpha
MISDTATVIKDCLSIVLAGEAGQGIQTIEQIVARMVKAAGYYVFSTSEFMSRIRGGCNSTQLRISTKPCSACIERIDILIPLDPESIPHLQKQISSKTIVIIDVPFSKLAAEVGGKIYANSIAAGMIAGLLGIDEAIVHRIFEAHFSGKDPAIGQKNTAAAIKGYAIGKQIAESGRIKIDLTRSEQAHELLILNGAEAVGLGAIAGGCNFVSSYPMSPSTGVLTYLAQNSREFGIIVEQAEDEIAALNMILGAWYAGARGLVTTSGGGFALMCEAVSLCGMIETPAVIHIGQRPGPATGLPTRTEQGDLDLTLYSGHGEFPRAIFTPGTLSDAFMVTQHAFNLADKYQIPVFILTDQFLLDSSAMTEPFDLSSIKNVSHITRSDKSYKRFALTKSGISPRGIPGFGEGFVCCDSDEHTEAGFITEDADIRVSMVDKRLRKLELVKKDVLPPRYEGGPCPETIVVCWGSTYSAAKEALSEIGRPEVSLLHLLQIYPFHNSITTYLTRAKNLIIIEGNATGQLAKLIRQEIGISIDKKILKYDGAPFSVEGLVAQIEKFL